MASLSSTSSLLSACRKLVCVGRNYAAHAAELGNAIPSKPVLFLKPSTSLCPSPSPILVPDEVTSLHHEVELGLVIGRTAKDISIQDAHSYVSGYVLALDMTARNIQDEAKKGGLPWSVAKGYDTFAPVSALLPLSALPADLLHEGTTSEVELWCSVYGVGRQRGSTALMLFRMPFLLAHISRIFTLEAGDIVLTGTPEGVGPVNIGDTITAGITGVKDSEIAIKVERRITPPM
jgi:acylpyruvate hydrolase